jgi:DnaJ family protein A protein 2
MPVETKYYDDLEITPDANSEQIAFAYRNISLQVHPLRNPQEHKTFFTTRFAAVSEAYEVLSKPSTKAIYDQFGIESLKQGIHVGEG